MPDLLSGATPWRRDRIVVPVASPAAGADWSLTVPGGHRYRIIAVGAQLVTSATAADRAARLALGDGVRTYAELPPSATQAASLTRAYAWTEHGSAYAAGSGIASPIPDLILAAGWTIASSTENIDAADQWSGIFLSVVDTWVMGGPIDLADVPDLVVEVSSLPAS